ncbi:MAG: fluoride efflux transporter CrcB [Pseudomonadota bacterium]
MQHFIPIAFGGALGALARYAITNGAHGSWGVPWPWGTLLINAGGSLVIGVIFTLLERGAMHPEWRSILVVGFLGAFTTFSTYSLESVTLWLEGQAFQAIGYALGSVVLCLAAAATGILLTRSLLS